jgi:hypothetical protein
MKNRIATLAIALFAVLSLNAFAQSNGQASADADAKIVAGISVSKVNDLKFGQIVRSASAGTVTLDAATGDRSAMGGVTLGLVDGARAAEFAVTGEPSYAFSITLPTSITLSKSGSNATMSVSNFTSTLTGNAGTLDVNGEASFNVGADLAVGANQETGVYSGDFTVVAAYN